VEEARVEDNRYRAKKEADEVARQGRRKHIRKRTRKLENGDKASKREVMLETATTQAAIEWLY